MRPVPVKERMAPHGEKKAEIPGETARCRRNDRRRHPLLRRHDRTGRRSPPGPGTGKPSRPERDPCGERRLSADRSRSAPDCRLARTSHGCGESECNRLDTSAPARRRECGRAGTAPRSADPAPPERPLPARPEPGAADRRRSAARDGPARIRRIGRWKRPGDDPRAGTDARPARHPGSRPRDISPSRALPRPRGGSSETRRTWR